MFILKSKHKKIKALNQIKITDFSQQLNETRSQRVRAALFPETFSEEIQVPSTHIHPQYPTTVQQLSEPSQMLKHALINLINYQVYMKIKFLF